MRSPIFGRRVHIAGSVPDNAEHAPTAEAQRAREFVAILVKELLKKGATFVVPVDAEKKRQDGTPICFDWLVWQTIKENMHLRPHGAPTPVAIAVKHHKNEEQIPAEFQDLWDEFSISDSVRIESAAHWNMNSKRMEVQARHGDVLVTVGGGRAFCFWRMSITTKVSLLYRWTSKSLPQDLARTVLSSTVRRGTTPRGFSKRPTAILPLPGLSD